MEPVVEAKSLWKRLGRSWALRGVTFTVHRGSLSVVLGPNGAGKTTLLRVLLGLYRVERGAVHIAGLEPREAVARGLVAYTPDEIGLYPRLTGAEHLELVSRLYGRLWERVWDAAEELGLSRVLGRRVGEYSRGMRRKLALLMALAADAPVTLLDEPLTGLDIASVYAAARILRGLAEQGKTIILTTHEVWLAERIATHVVILHEGRVLAQGSVESVKSGYGSLEALLLELMKGGGVERQG